MPIVLFAPSRLWRVVRCHWVCPPRRPRSASPTSPRRSASASPTTTAPSGRSTCRRRSAPARAFFDFDNDGRQDLFLVNGTNWPGQPPSTSRSKLYRNAGPGAFVDVTDRAGLSIDLYGMGVAIADFDNDGWQDLLVTAVGQNRLFRNTGKGTFVDVTARAGLGNSHRLQHVGDVVRLRPRRLARPARLQLRALDTGHRRPLQHGRQAEGVTARPRPIAARRRGSSAIAATAPSTTSRRRRDCSTRHPSRWA